MKYIIKMNISHDSNVKCKQCNKTFENNMIIVGDIYCELCRPKCKKCNIKNSITIGMPKYCNCI